MKKLFIVIEGIDCSGKTTQAELLKEYFITQEQQAVISPEPSNGIIGNIIRQALKQRIIFSRNRALFDEQMAYLFAADRHDHLYNDIDGVFKLIEDNYHVISTRYYFSSLAYNCDTVEADGCGLGGLSHEQPVREKFNFIKKLNDRFPNPDLTIYLDLPVEASLVRLQDRSLQEIYETKSKLVQVRQQYQKIFAEYDGKAIVLDATQDREQIHRLIVREVEATIASKQ